jgi:hypothetical protein
MSEKRNDGDDLHPANDLPSTLRLLADENGPAQIPLATLYEQKQAASIVAATIDDFVRTQHAQIHMRKTYDLVVFDDDERIAVAFQSHTEADGTIDTETLDALLQTFQTMQDIAKEKKSAVLVDIGYLTVSGPSKGSAFPEFLKMLAENQGYVLGPEPDHPTMTSLGAFRADEIDAAFGFYDETPADAAAHFSAAPNRSA